MVRNRKLVLSIILSGSILGLLFEQAEVERKLPANIFEVQANQNIQEEKQAPWTIKDKIIQAREILEGVDLFVGEDKITYYENRIEADSSGKIYTANVQRSEEAKEIALAVLNTETGEIKIVVIKKEGESLQGPSDMSIEVVTRPSGIRWNYWNTEYKISHPENLVVIGNRYPMLENTIVTERVRNSKGQMVSKKSTKRTIDYIYYVPYSEDLRRPELIEAGKEHIKKVVKEAFSNLNERNVVSRAVPGVEIAHLQSLKPEFFERLPLLEHSDLGEFILDPERTADRVLVIVGANGDQAYKKTCNGSGACGLVQFISSSYLSVKNNNPAADLLDDPVEGRADHVNVMMAAILHHDGVLGQLVSNFGDGILHDPSLEEYLAAGYNGSYAHVVSSLNLTLGKTVGDWTKKLKKETLGFIVKLRFIKNNNFI